MFVQRISSSGFCSLCRNESSHLYGRCFQCQENYCRTCFDHHAHFYPSTFHKTRTFKEIRFLPKAPIEFDEKISLTCSIKTHQRRPLEFFCLKCNECLCSGCLIDESKSHHRQENHSIKFLSEFAQENRYQLERLHSTKLKSIHRELNDAIEFLSQILHRDSRLILVLDQLQKQEEKVNQLEKLIVTLIHHAHDLHVVLFERHARETLIEILYERPPRPRQGFLLNGLRFEPISSKKINVFSSFSNAFLFLKTKDSRAILKLTLPIEILPTINNPAAQHIEHVYLDFLPNKNSHVQKPVVGYQVAYEQSDSTFLRLFGSLIPQQMKQFTCSLYSYSYVDKQFRKDETSERLMNFPKKFDFELKNSFNKEQIHFIDTDDQINIVYDTKHDCLTVKQFNTVFNLSIDEKKKENFLNYDIQLRSIQIRLVSNKEKFMIFALKKQSNKPICLLYDLHTLELLDTYSCCFSFPILEILDVLIYRDQIPLICFQTIDHRVFLWIGKENFEEIAFNGIQLAETKCVIDRLAISEQLDILLAYRNVEDDQTRTIFAMSKYLMPSVVEFSL